MTSKSFNWIWQQIEETIGDVDRQFSPEVKAQQNFQWVYGGETKKIIEKEYLILRNDLKLRCYAGTRDAQGNENLIDQHKIAACMCKAFIQKKIFTFTINDNISQEMLLSNYEVAYAVSLRIIFLYLIEYYLTHSHTEYAQVLIDMKKLMVPETTVTHDAYNMGRIKTLALNDYYGFDFDILTYSDMMYWIEHYNRQLIENTIQVKPENPLN